MNRKLFFALFVLLLAGLVSACNGTVPSVTSEPTAVIPTEVPPTAVPSPTPTTEPTIVPTDVPTPTATPELTVWEIAEQMLTECAGSTTELTTVSEESRRTYTDQLVNGLTLQYPETVNPRWIFGAGMTTVLRSDSGAPSPFADMDYHPQTVEEILWVSDPIHCEGYALFYEYIPENINGDGILVGEAYLFYEVSGTEPYVLDGELREVHFFFPPVP